LWVEMPRTFRFSLSAILYCRPRKWGCSPHWNPDPSGGQQGGVGRWIPLATAELDK